MKRLVVAALALTMALTTAAADAPPPMVLTLEKAMPGGVAPLVVYVNLADGKALALARKYNSAPHVADVSGLTFTADAIKGNLKVTVQPDAWVPKDHKPVDGQLALDVKLADGKGAGTYAGTMGKAKVEGAVQAVAFAESKPLTIKARLEDALPTGNKGKGETRIVLSCVVEGGKIGKVTVESRGDVALRKSELTAGGSTPVAGSSTLTGTLLVTSNGKELTIKLDGHMIAGAMAGKFQTLDGDKVVRTSVFSGAAE